MQKAVAQKTGAQNHLGAIIIPVAGMGLRMRSNCPKCLISLGRELLITRLVRQLRGRWPETPIFLCVGYDEVRIRQKTKASLHFVRCPDFESTNVAESLRLALAEAPSGPVLITMGDLIFSEESLASLSFAGEGVLWGETSLNRITEVGLTVTEQKRVGHLCHGLPIRWAQLAYLSAAARTHLSLLLEDSQSASWFVYEALNRLLQFIPLDFQPLNGWMVELDSPKDAKLARFAIQMEEEGFCAISD